MTGTVRNRVRTIALFDYGFRPFFLAAGLYAVVSIGAWLWTYLHGALPLRLLPPQYWHGHEMIFGFVGAAIAGFLLTAVPSWTGRSGFAGKRLIILAMLWLAGRVAFFMGDVLTLPLLAVAELSFVPTLALTLAPSLVNSGNRNTPMLFVLAAFWICDAVFILGMHGTNPAMSRTALYASLDLVLLLITIIGGRIVPAFTGNALRAAGKDISLRSGKLVTRLTIGSMIVYGLCDVLVGDCASTAVAAGLAAGLQLWRLSGWKGWRAAGQPIVWVLHVGYAWLPVGLALRAAWLADGFGWAAHWQHALGAGAAGMMIIAVMTRASLGHTGRALQVHGSISIAYGLLALSVFVRVFGATVLPLQYSSVVILAGILWVMAFIPYLAVYAPILIRPRADGKPG